MTIGDPESYEEGILNEAPTVLWALGGPGDHFEGDGLDSVRDPKTQTQ